MMLLAPNLVDRHVQGLPLPVEEPIDLVDVLEAKDTGRPWRQAFGWLAHAANWLLDREESRQADALGPRSWVLRAEAFLAGQEVFHVVRTDSRCDVGCWDRDARIWAFATAEGIALGAWGCLVNGSRPLEVFHPYQAIAGCSYNQPIRSLTIQMSRTEDLPALKMDAFDGFQMLAQIEKGRNP